MTSGFPLTFKGIEFSGPEAFYQALKFPCSPAAQRRVADAPNGMAAKKVAYEPQCKTLLRTDWDDIRVDAMKVTLILKLHQHYDAFNDALKATGDLQIVEFSERDSFWGASRVKNGYNGLNTLGHLLMELRELLVLPQTKDIAKKYLEGINMSRFKMNGYPLR